MIKLYSKLLLCCSLFIVLGFTASSQISVTATQGTAGPTTYTTLKAAIDAINAGTHKGNVSVSVTGNTTETAAITLDPSGFGPTLYTSIIVKPAAGVTATITGAVNSYLIALDSTQNVTFDGSNTAGGTTKDLTLQNTDAAGITVIVANSATGNVFKNLVVKGSPTGSGVIVIASAGSTAAGGNNNNLFENNDITRSSTGAPAAAIFNIGTAGKPNTGNVFRGNRIFDFGGNGYLDGNGTVGFSNNTLFERNEIFLNTASATTVYGIRLNNPTGVTNMTISRNYIHDVSSTLATGAAVGIDLYDAASVTVVNNMISMISNASSIRGIAQETGTPSTIKIYYNTVSVSGTATGTLSSFAFLKNYTSTGDDIKNNIFVNTRVSSGTGPQYAWAKTDVGTYTSNNNDIISTGNTNNILASITSGSTSTDYTTLAAFQTASSQDANSISVVPVFVSATNLHLSTAANTALDNKGTPIAGITVDYDNETRSTTTPDIGADEFTAATSTCTNPVITAQPTAQAACNSGTATFSVTATGTNLTYQWRKGGVNIAGATNATYTVNPVNAAAAGNYDVVVSSGTCSVTSNAVALTLNTATSITTQPTAVTVCTSQTATFTVVAAGQGTLTYQWRLNGANIAGATSATYTANTAGNYDVVVTGACGSVTSSAVALTITTCTAVSAIDADISSVLLLPNIVNSNAVIRVQARRAMSITWTIVDANGKTVMTFNRSVTAGRNDLSVDLSKLSGGLYQLMGSSSKGKTQTVRMLKQ